MNRLKQTCVWPLTGMLLLSAITVATEPARAADGDAARIARGKYLVTTSACHDCHTPWHVGPAGPEPDMSRMLSGHPESLVINQPATLSSGPWTLAAAPTNTAWSGAWGVSFTANLTPDPETGLGKWTQATFMQAIRTGRHMGRGRQILPPMPFAMYRNFTDEDLGAIFAYLRSIPPIKNRVPEPLPPGATAAAAEK
jgi:mono/diheme cytochrome c family protein